jgi:hypothetical protein
VWSRGHWFDQIDGRLGWGLDYRIAIHEAGHAVTAHELGLSIHSVSVTPDGGRFEQFEPTEWLKDDQNRTRFREAVLASVSPADRWTLYPQIVLSFAGRAAARRLGDDASGAEHDLEQARAIAASVSETWAEQSALLYMAERHAEDIVRNRWEDIERLADLLVREGELNATQIAALVK